MMGMGGRERHTSYNSPEEERKGKGVEFHYPFRDMLPVA
jgi:hypothetical protein